MQIILSKYITTEEPNIKGKEYLTLIIVGAFLGRIGLSPAVMGWAAFYDDGP